MGMIATVTPGTKRTRCIYRRKVSPREISATGKVEIHPLSEPRRSQVEIKYKNMVVAKVVDPTADFDISWKTALFSLESRAQLGVE